MKKGITLTALLLMSACDQIKDEFYTSGGYVAPVLDEATFKATTQKEQFHRYYYIAAITSPLALYTVTDEQGADDTIRHVARTLSHLAEYQASLEVCTQRETPAEGAQQADRKCNLTKTDGTGTVPVDIGSTSYGFETNGLQMQRNLERLASDIQSNVGTRIDASDPLKSVGDVIDLLMNVGDLIGPFRNFAASYRDTIHITTFSTARLCKQKKPQGDECKPLITAVNKYYNQGEKPPAVMSVEDAGHEERILKTLQRRTYNVVEKGDLAQYGFLDKEATQALNSQIYSACLHAAKYTDWKASEVTKACAGLEIPILTTGDVQEITQETQSQDAT